MNNFTCQGWLLHHKPVGETSASLKLFTRDYGLIEARYRGGMSPKKKILLQPFVLLDLTLNQSRDFYFVQNLEHAGLVPDLKGDLLFSAFYINELFVHLLRPLEPMESLYDYYGLLLSLLPELTLRSDLEETLRRFELLLLETLGLLVSFDHEAQSHVQIKPEEYYEFNPQSGFTKAQRGIPGAVILALARREFSSPEILAFAKIIMRKALDVVLGGKEIKSRRLFLCLGV